MKIFEKNSGHNLQAQKVADYFATQVKEGLFQEKNRVNETDFGMSYAIGKPHIYIMIKGTIAPPP